MKLSLTQEQIIKGMQLAYFLYPESEKSVEISVIALLNLEAERIKEKRWFRDDLKLLLEKLSSLSIGEYVYSPKIHLNDFQIYQKLIMQIVDEGEKQEELIKPLSEKLLIIRYLNYLILNGLDKKSILFLATSLTRILHNYTTADTIKICFFLYPNYKNIKNLDNQIKKAKANMLKQLQERFSGVINVVDNRLEAKSLSNLPNIQLLTQVINNALEELVLWETQCFTNFSTLDVSEPHNTLLIGQQMSHFIIHPNCYNFLTDKLKLENPKLKLEIPKFFNSNNMNDENDPFDPPDFTEDVPKVLDAVKKHFDEVKNCRPNQLAIYIDHKKRGIINLHQTNKFFLKLVNEGRKLEIYDEESNLFLLSRRLISDILLEKPETSIVVIPIENGQKFKLIITYIPPVDDGEDIDEDTYVHTDDGIFEISISCHETSLIRALYWSYRRLLYEFDFSPFIVLSRFAVTSILLIILGIFTIYPNKIFNLDNQQNIVKTSPIPITKQTPKPNVTPLPEPQKQNISPQQPKKINKPNKLQPQPKLQPQIVPPPTEQITEREPNEIAMVERGDNVTLATIKNIYISDLIESDLKQALIESLQANGFNVVKSLASDVVEGSLEYSLPETNIIILSIKNKTVWEKTIDQSSPKEQAQAIVRSLIEAIEKAKKDNKPK